MSKYNPNEFINALKIKFNGRGIPACPYCGGVKFTTTNQLATILTGDDTDSVNIGPSIPSGMIICEECGHIEFFALGALGLLTGKEADNNG